eukprot:CAMPEP_0175338212 /NCGR_PEP_ID=MMETSP0095-20121207/4723_1 /TAXON_ID=311494 /ORGANISM="Alexandrium monilatum, Strain CCMP3105" /LENGTH=216 /DNA_ID=CAMNT_0016635617 /DNA_START=216 /DNA_END=866 /DNA_ORIENTATION=+
MSIRSKTTFGSDFHTYGSLYFGSNTYMGVSGGALETYVLGNRVMSLKDTGGTLHGTWMADTVVAVSDRRLKDNITPITDSLQKNQEALDTSRPPKEIGSGKSKAPQALSWVLRQLRPVSYNFKTGSDAKNMRFGFIADEMQKVLPQVVRDLPRPEEPSKPDEPPKKGIVYPDLIAVLTAMMREFGTQMKDVQDRVKAAESELDRLERDDPLDPLFM